MLSDVEQTRLRLAKNTAAKKKVQFGRFLTPARTAAFMVSLFPDGKGRCRLLDAGAGIGSLSAAFLERWGAGKFHFRCVDLEAFEIDDSLHVDLNETLAQYREILAFGATIRPGDFIHAAVDRLSDNLFATDFSKYTHAILNPPYKKINGKSSYRSALRRVGIETVNLYSAFVALAVALAAPHGQIVAIIPRSFCNGPYYRSFRQFVLDRAALRHVHLFESRSTAFKDDAVLQENVIIRLERGGRPGAVTVSTSTDDTFTDLTTRTHPFDRIVFPDDSERFVHVPTSSESTVELSSSIRYALADLGIDVSTGPVVDFRLKEYLRNTPEADCVPLLYPSHFTGTRTTWPISGTKKPNAILHNDETEKWLYPNGYYCVVRRFSSKEEPRRIVTGVVDPDAFPDVPALGFENHLNLFHQNKHGLPKALAFGLSVFLNSTAVDKTFRRFSGHTQVNATDLRMMKYPSRDALIGIGKWAVRHKELTQTMIDAKVGTLTE